MTTATLRSTKFVAGLVIGLVFGLLSVFWLSEMPLVEQASAQLSDPGAQRNLLHQDLSAISGKMDVLIKLLKSGQIKVTCPQADNQKAGVIPHETPQPNDALQPKVRDKAPTTGTNRTSADSD